MLCSDSTPGADDASVSANTTFSLFNGLIPLLLSGLQGLPLLETEPEQATTGTTQYNGHSTPGFKANENRLTTEIKSCNQEVVCYMQGGCRRNCCDGGDLAQRI